MEQVLKLCSFTEKWVKAVPQGSTSVEKGVRVGEGRCFSLPSLESPSLRLSGCRKSNRSSRLPHSRKMGNVW